MSDFSITRLLKENRPHLSGKKRAAGIIDSEKMYIGGGDESKNDPCGLDKCEAMSIKSNGTTE